MEIPGSISEVLGSVARVVGGAIEVVDQRGLSSEVVDLLAWLAVFGDPSERAAARWVVWEIGQRVGVRPASIHDLYMERGKGAVPANFVVPAFNIRGMSYEVARGLFRQALAQRVGAFICELARSEMEYTGQSAAEYVAVVLAAALREGYSGAVFLQGDHFQVKRKTWGVAQEGEREALQGLIEQTVGAGMYNIDIDSSTLVDPTKASVSGQQQENVSWCAQLSAFVRSVEPEGVKVCLGGEIGEVGGHTSMEEELRAFLDGYRELSGGRLMGLAKVSIQTGTRHGGEVSPEGKVEPMAVDFDVVSRLSRVAREEYGLAGVVQHGASTLPDAVFEKFAEAGACEIHLSTGLQNRIFDHPQFPQELLSQMYGWIDRSFADERSTGQTEAQFHYRLRKRAWGEYKKACWEIAEERRAAIRGSLEEWFAFLFRAFRVVETRALVEGLVAAPVVHKRLEDFQ